MTSNHLQLACKRLDPNNLECGLPGREEQLSAIYNFLFNRLKIRKTVAQKRAKVKSGEVANINSRHDCKTIFICGVPGTGKTASVQTIIHKLNKELRSKDPPTINEFNYAYINAQHLASPERLYSELYYQLFGKNCRDSDRAQEQLDLIFRPSENNSATKKLDDLISPFKVIVIDELDLLYNDKREDIYYNLFDWPTLAESKMILVVIANAMDLPERMQKKVSSRLGWEKWVFEPYKSGNLETILTARLGEPLLQKCFDRAAIAVATKRVGRTTGDARRILDICRQALAYAIRMKLPKVTGEIMDKVGFENINFIMRDYIYSCGAFHLLALKALVLLTSRNEEDNIKVFNVHEQIFYLMQRNEFFKGQTIGVSELYSVLNDLATTSLIYLEPDVPLYNKRLYLRDPSEVTIDLIKSEPLKSLV